MANLDDNRDPGAYDRVEQGSKDTPRNSKINFFEKDWFIFSLINGTIFYYSTELQNSFLLSYPKTGDTGEKKQDSGLIAFQTLKLAIITKEDSLPHMVCEFDGLNRGMDFGVLTPEEVSLLESKLDSMNAILGTQSSGVQDIKTSTGNDVNTTLMGE